MFSHVDNEKQNILSLATLRKDILKRYFKQTIKIIKDNTSSNVDT